MKIVITPDSFKGSLSADQICRIIGSQVKKFLPDAEVAAFPVSDGGEGMVDSLLGVMDGKRVSCEALDPCFKKITADYGILEDGTAVIEMAAASGLPLVPEGKRNPMETTTYGTGELMKDAFSKGCRKFILGIGGSATTDGGIGAASALGIRFLNESGQEVALSGKGLSAIKRIDVTGLDPKWKECEIIIACDVDNPLCGENGSAAVYGPQKGADPEMIKCLDAGLSNLETVISDQTGIVYRDRSGIGAAGGFSLPFVAFFNAELRPGLDIVLDVLEFDQKISGADLVITGEGKTDFQSAMGKVLSGVAERSHRQGIPVIALSGALEEGYEKLYEMGMTAAFSTWCSGKDLEWQMTHAEENLKRTSEDLLRLIKAFCS